MRMKDGTKLVFLILVFLFVSFMVVSSTESFHQDSQGHEIILTMTTFMDKDNRLQNFQQFIHSFQEHHPSKYNDGSIFKGYVGKVVVINEAGSNDYTNFMKKNFPEIIFIQKDAKDQGQARSLNILIEKFLLRDKSLRYWIHWEDSWVVDRPLFPDLVDIMEKSPQVSQLQLTNDWRKGTSRSNTGHCIIIHPDPELGMDMNVYQKLDTLDISKWHLYSLRPSIHRLSFFQEKLYPFYFLEDRNLWPIWFEWEFARHFVRCGGIKAISHHVYASRIPNHKHSYADRWNDLNK